MGRPEIPRRVTDLLSEIEGFNDSPAAKELSVIGYDDSRLSRLTHTDLTTVAQDAEQMARWQWRRSSSDWRTTLLCRRATVSSTPPRAGPRGHRASPTRDLSKGEIEDWGGRP